MIKRALLVGIGVLGLSLSMNAQRTAKSDLLAEDETFTPNELRITGEVDTAPALALYRPDLFSTIDGSVLLHGLPVLTLLDGRRFPISGELGRMGVAPLNIFPIALLSAVEVHGVGASPFYGSDNPGGVVNLHLNRVYSGGEVGFFYGKSGGKYGREDMQYYIVGGVGNDKVHITAGASYEESSGRLPRFRQ